MEENNSNDEDYEQISDECIHCSNPEVDEEVTANVSDDRFGFEKVYKIPLCSLCGGVLKITQYNSEGIATYNEYSGKSVSSDEIQYSVQKSLNKSLEADLEEFSNEGEGQ